MSARYCHNPQGFEWSSCLEDPNSHPEICAWPQCGPEKQGADVGKKGEGRRCCREVQEHTQEGETEGRLGVCPVWGPQCTSG